MFRIAIAFTLLTLASCSSNTSETSPSAMVLEGEDLEIAEALFRYQFEHSCMVKEMRSPVDHYFLAVGDGQDPPAELMERPSGHSPRIWPISKSTNRLDSGLPAQHVEHGGSGLIFWIERITWIDEDSVEVEATDFQSGASAAEGTYDLEKQEGRWICTEFHLESYS